MDISGMGTAGANGTGMSMLVSSKALSNWPPLGGSLGVSTSLTNGGPQPNTGSVTTGAWDYGCYSIGGYVGNMARSIIVYNNQNYVVYKFLSNIGNASPCTTSNGVFQTDSTDTTQINHPVVQIAKAINTTLNQMPAAVKTGAMQAIGLPVPVSLSGWTNASGLYDTSTIYAAHMVLDSNGQIQTNYCYFHYAGAVNSITCVFGPS